jgi:PAS domain S-box-containing protein
VADQKTLDDVNDRLGADLALRAAILSLELSTDSICWFDAAARVVYANPAACRNLDYSIEELIGLLATDINPTYPADPARWSEALASQAEDGTVPLPPWLAALLEGASSQTYETVHRRKDGRLLAVEVSAAPLELGGRRYIVAVARDVSSRRWMESALRNVASEVDKLFEVTLEMLCVADQRGVFRRLNPAWERVLGFNAAELMSRPLFDLVHLDDRATTLDAFKRMASHGAVVSFANRVQKKEGGYCWLQWRCAPDGEKIFAAVRDVTARMTADEAGAATDAGPQPSAPETGTPPVRVATDPSPQPAAPASSRLRVLVVEDNRLNQRVARQMLEHMGITVETAGDGREAVEAMRRGPDRFDAILMDMQMPEMDGLQATRVIRTEFPKHAVPIIAATASVEGTDMTDCLDAGMNDYVPKPIEPRQLERVLSRWVTLPSALSGPGADREAEPGACRLDFGPAGGPTPLEGVDVNTALVRLNGQHDLLVRLLRVFAQEHGKTSADIAAAIAREDYDGALRVVHNLKGVAGTLSATAVFEAARALESGLRNGHQGSLPALLDRLGRALDVVCRSVSEWTGGPRSARPDEASHEPDRPAAAALLAELDTLLKNRRFSARPRFEQLRGQLALPELAPTIELVQRCLDRLEFQQARELLPALASAIGVTFTRA